MRILLSAALLLAASAGAQQPPSPVQADAIREDVRVLSSDAFQGRGPGERGETVTLAYLRDQFEAAGLSPGGPGGSPVVRSDEMALTRGPLGLGTLARTPLDGAVDLTALAAQAAARGQTRGDRLARHVALLRERGAAIDWLLTDIGLPGVIDGWMVADEYRLSHPLRPVVYASTAACDRRRTVVGSIFVEKPFPMAEIARLARMMTGEAARAVA